MSSVNYSSIRGKIDIPTGEEGKVHEFNYDLKDDVKTHNLDLLFHRKKGEIFYVDEQDRLQEATNLSQRLKARWQGPEKIKNVVTDTLNSFSTFLSQYEDERVARLAVSHLFSNDSSMGRLSHKIFDRQFFKKDDGLSKLLIDKNVIRLKIGNAGYYDFKINEKDPTQGQLLEIDLQDPVSNQNLYTILTLQKGEKLREQATVIHQVAEGIIEDLEVYLKKSRIKEVHRLAVCHILTESKFYSLNKELFKIAKKEKRAGPSHVIPEADSAIVDILVPKFKQAQRDLTDAMKEIRDSGVNPRSLRAFEEAGLELCEAERVLNQRLGDDLEKIDDGGSGGARVARDRFRNRITVVKPGDEGPAGENNPKWYAPIKKLFVSPRRSLFGNSEPLAEVESWLIDRIFGLYVVPPTQLRYVESDDFNGQRRKECSVQMWVDGCEPLSKVVDSVTGFGKYISISKLFRFPRPFLRWLLKRNESEINKIIPQAAMERVACHDAITGDTDRHLENVIWLVGDNKGDDLLDRLFDGKVVTDDEIKNFSEKFFTENNRMRLLKKLLHPEVNEKGERVWSIKPDGGSSCGHSQPKGYFSLCYKYLFEVLPHFEKGFTLQKLFIDQEDKFVNGLMESTIQSIRNILSPKAFTQFWKSEDNRKLLKSWMFEMDDAKEAKDRADLIEILCKLTIGEKNKNKISKKYKFYFNYHLLRIGGNLETRIQNWRVLNKWLKDPENPQMREFFKNVKSESEIQRELYNLKDQFTKNRMQGWQSGPVKQGDALYAESDDLSMTILLNDFGVAG